MLILVHLHNLAEFALRLFLKSRMQCRHGFVASENLDSNLCINENDHFTQRNSFLIVGVCRLRKS